MVTNVLIASPTMAFGELIRLTLEGEGNYRATHVSTGSEALEQCQSTLFALAILDADLSDLPLQEVLTGVQKHNPDIRLILVPPNNNPQSPSIAGLACNGYLSKPFYLPDLMDIVTRALKNPDQIPNVQPAAETPAARTIPSPQNHPAPAIDGASPKRPPSKPLASTAPAWLQDVARAAQHLTRLSLETAALAALIIRDGKLWAYAGQLSQPAAQELAQTVAHYWERGNGSDLARFVHLNATDCDYMLYATAVSVDMALAMAFDIEMPFSKIRSQASRLARSLASPPGSELVKPIEAAIPPTVSPRAEQDVMEEAETVDLASLTPLFEDVPPATPANLPPALPADAHPPAAWQAVIPSAGRSTLVHPETFHPTQPHAPQPVEPHPSSHPDSAPEEAAQDGFEPVSPEIYNLNYACMMIPRMPSHMVEGDLARRLFEWVPQLSLAYGWRLDQLAIYPDYMTWVVSVPPTVSPSFMMRIIRQQTSARIFAHFPILGQDNPSGDFWAPGYLIMSSSHLPPDALVKNYITQTRQRQGVSRPMDIKNIHG